MSSATMQTMAQGIAGQPLSSPRRALKGNPASLPARGNSLNLPSRGNPIVRAYSTQRRTIRTSALLNFFNKKTAAPPAKPVRETIVLNPSYNLQAALIGIAGLEAYQGWWPIAGFTGLLGVFLTIQASRVKFIFDDEALEIKIGGSDSDNVVTGTPNRWAYSSFTNWELWWPAFPVLVYFKENQTKPEGQIHFFPIIFDGQQVFKVMSERCGPRISQEGKE